MRRLLTLGLTLALLAAGTVGPISLDPGGGYDLGGYRWDVTSFVTGNGTYTFDITGVSLSYFAGLAVVYSDASLGLGEVRVNDGAESLLADTSTTTFSG